MTLTEDKPRSATAVCEESVAEKTSTPLIRVENLRVSFRSAGSPAPHEAVKGISFSIYPGETVGIVGESGSGKSVTVRSLLGLQAPHQKTVADRLKVFGRDGLSLTEHQWGQIRGSRIGFVLQDALSSLDPLKTIGQEVAEAVAPREYKPWRKQREKVHALLADVGIPNPEIRARQYSHELSGGLRQRALIASALAQDPSLIIADEPTTALDVTVQAQVLSVLRDKAQEGHALIVVSHDLAVIASICDRILVMKEGRIVEQGTRADILTQPREEYTQLLLAAVPSRHSKGFRLSSIERIPLPPRNHAGGDVVLAARGITKDFVGRNGSHVHAVRDASITLYKGQTLGVVGESGSGKSTLARIIAGLIEPDSGTVTIGGQAWVPLPEKKRRSRRGALQIVSQNPLASFDPRFSVEALIAEPLRYLEYASARRVKERIADVLGLVGLPREIARASAHQLSGGQRQRVAIARAIATDPQVLIADEAVSALDVSIQAQILDLLADIQARTGVAILFISHDLGVIHHVSDSIVVMRRGEIVEEGSPDRVLVHPEHPYTQELVASLPRLPRMY